jgi:threonine aldolase
MVIDYRSDTFTKPTAGMLAAMMSAEVGDDVFSEDPSINKLEAMTAEMFGRESALYCPTGTMSNQIAIKCHTSPGDEIICERNAHVYIYEGGGIAFNSSAQTKPLEGDRGRIKAEQILDAINPDDVHKARTSLVCLENTSNRGGGSCYDFHEIKRIKNVCSAHNLKLHLDGARLFNAMVRKNENAEEYGKVFDSISVCLNKGLGCPIGSILIGSKDFIRKARRVRKVLGGGMRQAGFMAAAGIYALQHHIKRLELDHVHALQIADALSRKAFAGKIMPVETNIVIFEIIGDYSAATFTNLLAKHHIKAMAISANQVRMVTHLDVNEEMIRKTISVINEIE